MKRRTTWDRIMDSVSNWYEDVKEYLALASIVATGMGLYHVVGTLFHHIFGYVTK